MNCLFCAGAGEVCPDCSRPDRCECGVPRTTCAGCLGRGFLASRCAGELREPTADDLAALERS